jgi:integrase
VDLSSSSLPAYATWLREHGRAELTIQQYLSCLRQSATLAGGPTGRLIDRHLAPKTRRVYLAALRSWAVYAEDAALTKRLAQIKLPPAIRVATKVELARDDWRRLILHLQGTEPGALRAVLLIMALRGLRCGDVLRLARRDVQTALRTGKLSFEAKGARRIEYDATPILEPLRELADLPRWGHVRDLVIDHGDAQPRKVRRALAAIARELKIEGLHPHRLRRTYATYYVRALDRDPQSLIKLMTHMGWTSVNTASGYVDATNADELAAVGSKMVSDLLGVG